MKVLGMLSRKGGAGKTTIAAHLAVAAEQAGKRTLILDADPQRSAASWWQAREATTPQMEAAEPAKLAALIEAARTAGMDLVVIDTRPSVEADAVEVAKLSDFLLIPTRPAILDLRAILGTLDIVKGSSRKAAIVLNACPSGRGIFEAGVTADARKALKAFGVPVAPAVLTQRAAFSHALVSGQTVTEAEPKGKAAAEVNALWKFVEREISR
ncbi:ParA family protein [Pseudoroseomonas wenyumeiae]|uniref:ParA family protein n=1 Tax=Teichococcus wenyumeiae TaxID=2478470 RepID=A0A3A9J7T4_9PROT|nr:AAA family ATPase [Pseudoroseomonas wenyumeiae]RKK03307.1 ParA family protein [Pseudoroseomonas wenyumeiae]RMI14579.1 ParA family protein [Pseudoroseomonas wenyumeiae]